MDMRGKWIRPKRTLENLMDNAIPEPNSGCFLWLGYLTDSGYGQVTWEGRKMNAHRVAYILSSGDQADGLEIDHLCRVRCCVNPTHLEAVPKITNIRRGEAGTAHAVRQRAKTHCPYGHPYSGENLFTRQVSGYRECRICMRERQSRSEEIRT